MFYSSVLGHKKDIRVSNVPSVLLCLSLIPFGPLSNMNAPKPFHFTCIKSRKCEYEHVLIPPHTLFAFSYRTCYLLASPSHFHSNKNTVQRPQRRWPCSQWKVESSCWQADYRPLTWSHTMDTVVHAGLHFLYSPLSHLHFQHLQC